jgi:hypothetical protein
MKNNFISLITEKILNEISNEGELSKEISVLDNSEQAIQKAQQKLQTLTEMS